MKILFRKILDYDLKNNKPNAFVYVCQVLSQKIDPYSLKRKGFTLRNRVIFCSNLNRAKQCIKKDKNTKLVIIKSLNEIPFNLKLYCDKSGYKKYGSVVVRKTFKKLFIEDNLIISRKKVFKEIKELLIYIKNRYSSEKSVTIVSHSFRLKCIEAYLKTDGKITKFPKLIKKYIKDNEKTFDFGAGFDFDIF
ncbi:MAG: hypothetical protein WCG28_00605 [bacterium]